MQLNIYKNAEEATTALAEWVESLIAKTLKTKEYFFIALSGGETPKKLYQKFASDNFRERIDWKKIQIFWGDERVVPFIDKNNNAKMAFDNLLGKINIPSGQIHPIQTDIPPEKSADEYQVLLHTFFDKKGIKSFDLIITDVIMPRMGGKILANNLKKKMPEIKILFVSGYTDQDIEKDGILQDGAFLLRKPYSLSEFALKVREVLDHAV